MDRACHLEGRRRHATLEDLDNLQKPNHIAASLHMVGGPIVEPVDVAVPHRHLHMTLSALILSDKPIIGNVTARSRKRSGTSSRAASGRYRPLAGLSAGASARSEEEKIRRVEILDRESSEQNRSAARVREIEQNVASYRSGIHVVEAVQAESAKFDSIFAIHELDYPVISMRDLGRVEATPENKYIVPATSVKKVVASVAVEVVVAPPPLHSLSLPAPPSSTSLPACPASVSLPALPSRISSPVWPWSRSLF